MNRTARFLTELFKGGRAGVARWKERMGEIPSQSSSTVVFHCHDIGEVKTLLPLLPHFFPKDDSSSAVFWVYSRDAHRYLKLKKEAGSIFYAPYYDSECVTRGLRRLKARSLVIVESDFSPVYIETAKTLGLSTLALNFSRIHWRDRDLHGYPLDRFREMLAGMDLVTFKTGSVRDSFFPESVPPPHLSLAGNLRYAVTESVSDLEDPHFKVLLDRTKKESFILVAGSTYENEEEILLNALKEFLDTGRVHLILAPRKPWKGSRTARLAASKGFDVKKRSSINGDSRLPAVLVLDTMGELSPLYGFCHAAFIGGTIRNKGGHNFFEAAKFGIPMIFGPHFENNIDLASDLLASGGGIRAENEGEIRGAIDAWVSDEEKRAADGNRVKRCIGEQRTQLERIQKAVREILG